MSEYDLKFDQDTYLEIVNLIPELIKNSDYEGYSAGKYYFKSSRNGMGLFGNAVKKLNIRQTLNKLKKGSLADDIFDHHLRRIEKVMVSIPYVSGPMTSGSTSVPKEQADGYVSDFTKLEIYESKNKVSDLYGDIIFYNKEKNRVLTVDEARPELICKSMNTTIHELRASSIPVIVPTVFNPANPNRFYNGIDPSFGSEVSFLNLANPPLWRSTMSAGVRPRYRGFIRRLIEHLFTDPEERVYVLNWIHHALVKRAQTALILVGARGAGKTTFIEIVAHCIGWDYYQIVDQSFITDKFNSQIFQTRLLNFEEIALDAEAMSMVKRLTNDTISVQSKGKDPITVPNHSSMIFVFNEPHDVKISQVERRPSMPRLTDKILQSSISSEEIAEFVSGYKNGNQSVMDQIAEFSLYMIEDWKPTKDSFHAIKGEYFYEVTDNNLPQWQKDIIEYVAQNGVAQEYCSFKDAIPPSKDDKYRVQRPKIEDFIRDYRYQGRARLGFFVDDPSESLVFEEQIPKPVASKMNSMNSKSTTRRTRKYGIMVNGDFLELHREMQKKRRVKILNIMEQSKKEAITELDDADLL